MNAFGIVLLICLTALMLQRQHHAYRGIELEARVDALEKQRADSFDPKAFTDLQSKVEALRLAKGLR
jgi:hypothetical protein